MPRGGTKCPDCGYRFKERRDLVKSESKILGFAPNDQIRVYICPGKGNKGKHPPQMVEIKRIKVSDSSQLVKMKIISAVGAELLDEFTDAWIQENLKKYRPDLASGIAIVK